MGCMRKRIGLFIQAKKTCKRELALAHYRVHAAAYRVCAEAYRVCAEAYAVARSRALVVYTALSYYCKVPGLKLLVYEALSY